jgi:hypothetical protein
VENEDKDTRPRVTKEPTVFVTDNMSVKLMEQETTNKQSTVKKFEKIRKSIEGCTCEELFTSKEYSLEERTAEGFRRNGEYSKNARALTEKLDKSEWKEYVGPIRGNPYDLEQEDWDDWQDE